MLFGAAERDPRRFDDPDRVRHRPRRHRAHRLRRRHPLLRRCAAGPPGDRGVHRGDRDPVPGAGARRRARLSPDVRDPRPHRPPADARPLSSGQRPRISSRRSGQARGRHARVHVGQGLESLRGDLVSACHAPSVGPVLETAHRPLRRRLHVTSRLQEHARGIAVLLQDARIGENVLVLTLQPLQLGNGLVEAHRADAVRDWRGWSSWAPRGEVVDVRATRGMEWLNATRTALLEARCGSIPDRTRPSSVQHTGPTSGSARGSGQRVGYAPAGRGSSPPSGTCPVSTSVRATSRSFSLRCCEALRRMANAWSAVMCSRSMRIPWAWPITSR